MNRAKDRLKWASRWSAIAGAILLSVAFSSHAQQPDQRLVANCDAGDLGACNEVGVYYDSAKSPELAGQYLWLACDGGYQLACSNLGELFYDGRGVDRDYELALALFSEACAADVLSGCAGVCLSAAQTGALEPDMVDTCRQALDAACDEGNPWMCNRAVAGSGSPFAPAAPASAGPSLETRCENGDMNACNSVGFNLDQANRANEAGQYYFRACDGGLAIACSNLGELFYDGRGVARDVELALTLFSTACQDGVTDGCAGMCLAAQDTNQLESDMRDTCQTALNQACNEGNPWMCNRRIR